MIDESRIARLIVKYLHDELLPDEKGELDAWLSESSDNRYFLETFDKQELWESRRILLEKDDAAIRRRFEFLLRQERRQVRVHRIWQASQAAAAVFLCCMIWYSSYRHHFGDGSEEMIAVANTDSGDRSVIKGGYAGRHQAILTLSNGAAVDLGRAPVGVVTEEGNLRIKKVADDRIVCEEIVAAEEIEGSNTITVEPESRYRILLADGTDVILNAGTTLQLSVKADADRRVVNMNGEAYFDIAKDARRPFYVKAGETQIKVLGTTFNVHSYKEESQTTVTLSTGKVEVVKDTVRQLLTRGKEASISKGIACIEVGDADTAECLAWKNPDGQRSLYFDKPRLDRTLWTIVHWYGLKGYKFRNGAQHASYPTGGIEAGLPLHDLMGFLRRPDLSVEIENNYFIISRS